MAMVVDALIVGGGPAGASCALWLKLLGFTPVIIERRPVLGGLQNDSPYSNRWIATVMGRTGDEVAREIHQHILSHDIECMFNTTVEKVTRAKGGKGFVVAHSGGAEIRAATVVLASGVRSATGGLRAAFNVIVGPGHEVASGSCAGKSVAVLGGGDSAFENYLFLKERGARRVHIYARSVRARQEFIEKVPPADVSLGEYQVDQDRSLIDGEHYDMIVVLYGWTPQLEYVSDLGLGRDAHGRVVTGPDCDTSVSGVFAIGEVAQRTHPCCVTAMADGVVAAKAIQRMLEKDSLRRFVAAANRTRSLMGAALT